MQKSQVLAQFFVILYESLLSQTFLDCKTPTTPVLILTLNM
jgi:hypothetical protein